MTNPIQFSEIEAMRAGASYAFPARIRGFTVMLRPITLLEWDESNCIAEDAIQEMKPQMQTMQRLALLKSREYLKRSSSSAPGAQDYKLTDVLFDQMTPDEFTALYEYYDLCVKRVNPSLETLPTEKLTEIVEAIKKKDSEVTELFLSQLLKSLDLAIIPLK